MLLLAMALGFAAVFAGCGPCQDMMKGVKEAKEMAEQGVQFTPPENGKINAEQAKAYVAAGRAFKAWEASDEYKQGMAELQKMPTKAIGWGVQIAKKWDEVCIASGLKSYAEYTWIAGVSADPDNAALIDKASKATKS
jgi:hypothetical protein